MSDTFFVVPAPGARVRFPDRPQDFLPEGGASVPRNQFWIRRLLAGEVIETTPPAESKAAAPKKGE